MPEGLKKLWEKIKTFWTDLEKGQKVRIFTLLGVVVAAIVITVALTLKVEYVQLFDTSQVVSLHPVVIYLTENN